MSIILDALRRGRAAQAPGPNPNAAQTDAVLQTLANGRFSPAAPLNRLKRVLLILAFAVLTGIGLWVAAIWLTHAYLSPGPPDPHGVASVAALAPPSKPAQPPQTQQPVDATQQTGPPAEKVALPSNGPVAAEGPSHPVPVVMPPSRRVSTPSSTPLAPASAPSSTGTSKAATAKAATVTTGDDYFRRGVMYQRLGDFNNALVSYRQVLQRDDLDVEAHNNLGVLYRDQGLYDDAITHFQRAIAINPGYARARNNLGAVYLSLRKLDTAASQFHAALAIDPKNVESMVNLSTVEKESGRRDQASGWLARALEADPHNAEAHYNLGLLEDEAGNRAKAVAHYRAFLQYGAAVHPALVADVRTRLQKLEPESRF